MPPRVTHEFTAGSAPASAIEREKRQNDALDTVNAIARAAGNTLEVKALPDGQFDSRSGIYLLDPQLGSPHGVKDAEFVFEQRMLSGAADSAHAVIAGSLTVEHMDGRAAECEVAAKCYQKRTFEERFARAQREVEVMRDMQARGELGLDPMAIAVTPEAAGGAVVLLSRFDKSLYTLDNAPWMRGPTEPNIGNAILSANALGRFNAMGYRHRDAKVKNVASFAGRGVAMIDFETTDPIDLNNLNDVSDAVYQDLEYMLSSMADKGMLRMRPTRVGGDNSKQIIDAVQRICEDGYLPAWESADIGVQEAVYGMTLAAAEGAVERALGQRASV